MQIWFHSIEGFTVNVSTHGYFSIYTSKMSQAIDLPSHLYQGSINELGFEYLPYPADDINVELGDDTLEVACRQYIRRHLVELQAKEVVALELWEEIRNGPPLTGFGDAIRMGYKVAMVAVGGEEEIIPETIEIIYYDLGKNTLLFKYLDTDINPLLRNVVLECGLQGSGWRRHFTKIEK